MLIIWSEFVLEWVNRMGKSKDERVGRCSEVND